MLKNKTDFPQYLALFSQRFGRPIHGVDEPHDQIFLRGQLIRHLAKRRPERVAACFPCLRTDSSHQKWLLLSILR